MHIETKLREDRAQLTELRISLKTQLYEAKKKRAICGVTEELNNYIDSLAQRRNDADRLIQAIDDYLLKGIFEIILRKQQLKTTAKMYEVKLGDTATVEIEAVESDNGCEGCIFNGTECTMFNTIEFKCLDEMRRDGKNVIFKMKRINYYKK